jgi:PhnB protein
MIDMQLQPFIYFYGRCEEALAHYRDALGGTFDIVQRNGESPDPRLDPSFRGKVSYATFAAPGISFAASDGPRARTIDPAEGNISLALTIPDLAFAERAFAKLTDGGSVMAPLGSAPWGGTFGIVHDRFGTEWIVTVPPAAPL